MALFSSPKIRLVCTRTVTLRGAPDEAGNAHEGKYMRMKHLLTVMSKNTIICPSSEPKARYIRALDRAKVLMSGCGTSKTSADDKRFRCVEDLANIRICTPLTSADEAGRASGLSTWDGRLSSLASRVGRLIACFILRNPYLHVEKTCPEHKNSFSCYTHYYECVSHDQTTYASQRVHILPTRAIHLYC